MVTEQLISYIRQQTAAGETPENIKKTLRANGWGQTDIEQAMKSLAALRQDDAQQIKAEDFKTQNEAPEATGTIHRIFPSSKFRPPGILPHLAGQKDIPLRPAGFSGRQSVDFSYLQKPSWIFNIFAGLLIISATIVGLNLFFPFIDAPTGAPTAEEEKEAELARLVAGDPIVAGLIVSAEAFNHPKISLGAQETGLGGPKNTYIKFKNEFDQTKNYYEMEALLLKYGSRSKVAQIQAGRTTIENYPPEILANLFEKTKARTPTASEIATIQEGVSGNSATLIALTNKSNIQGTINLIFENGLWKIVSETWKGYAATN